MKIVEHSKWDFFHIKYNTQNLENGNFQRRLSFRLIFAEEEEGKKVSPLGYFRIQFSILSITLTLSLSHESNVLKQQPHQQHGSDNFCSFQVFKYFLCTFHLPHHHHHHQPNADFQFNFFNTSAPLSPVCKYLMRDENKLNFYTIEKQFSENSRSREKIHWVICHIHVGEMCGVEYVTILWIMLPWYAALIHLLFNLQNGNVKALMHTITTALFLSLWCDDGFVL